MKILTHEGLQYFYNQIAAKFSTKEQTAEAIEEAVGNAGVGTVTSVNGKTGVVQLSASDVGAATETYVDNKVASMVDSAPETLNTLNELAAALGDDPNFATTVATEIGGKVNKSGDTMTGILALDDNPPTLDLYCNGVLTGRVQGIKDSSSGKHHVRLGVHAPNSNYYEYYATSSLGEGELTGHKYYTILTSKSPVTIAQGGTGATTADAACANLGAVKKSGDTMTGDLITTTTYAKGNYPAHGYMKADGTPVVLMQVDTNHHRLAIHQKRGGASVWESNEAYFLPAPNLDQTATVAYDILTSKNPVTIAQGGTGATTAQDAAHSLIRGNAIAPANIEFWPASDTATHGGYLDFHFNQASDDYTSRIIESAKGVLDINIFGDVRVGNITYGNWKGSAIPVAYGGTGATDAITALKNLGAFGALGNAGDYGSDLNNFTQIGAVLVSSDVANRPEGTSVYGICWNVFGQAGTYLEQHYVNAATLKRYVRFRIDNVWRAWAQEYDSNFKPTLAEIGAAPASHTHNFITDGNASAFVGVATTPILSVRKGSYNHWGIERVGDSDNRLKWHYYDPSTGSWQGNAILIDSNGGTINGAVTINNTLTATKVIGAVYA